MAGGRAAGFSGEVWRIGVFPLAFLLRKKLPVGDRLTFGQATPKSEIVWLRQADSLIAISGFGETGNFTDEFGGFSGEHLHQVNAVTLGFTHLLADKLD